MSKRVTITTEQGMKPVSTNGEDAKISLWLSVDPLAEKYPSMTPYNYCAHNPIKFVDPDGKEPIIVITTEIVGYANVKISNSEGLATNGGYLNIKVPLYKAYVYDDQDPNFKMEFMVTRDAWRIKKVNSNGTFDLDNLAFEPADKNKNTYKGTYIDSFPKGNDTPAYALTEDGNRNLKSEPRVNVDGDLVEYVTDAMIHVGGIYYNEKSKTNKHAASEACFTIVNKDNSYKNKSDDETKRVIDGIREQSDEDATWFYSDVNIIIQKRENVQRETTVHEK